MEKEIPVLYKRKEECCGWSARWIDVLCGDEDKKASIKLDEIVIYWKR